MSGAGSTTTSRRRGSPTRPTLPRSTIRETSPRRPTGGWYRTTGSSAPGPGNRRVQPGRAPRGAPRAIRAHVHPEADREDLRAFTLDRAGLPRPRPRRGPAGQAAPAPGSGFGDPDERRRGRPGERRGRDLLGGQYAVGVPAASAPPRWPASGRGG